MTLLKLWIPQFVKLFWISWSPNYILPMNSKNYEPRIKVFTFQASICFWSFFWHTLTLELKKNIKIKRKFSEQNRFRSFFENIVSKCLVLPILNMWLNYPASPACIPVILVIPVLNSWLSYPVRPAESI